MSPAQTKRTTPKKTSAQRTAEKRAEARAALEDSDALTFEIRGKQFTVRIDEVSASMSRRYRAETGMSVTRTVQLVTSEPDPDVWQCMVFLARLQAGEDITIDDVDDYAFADLLTLDVVDIAEGDPDDPER